MSVLGWKAFNDARDIPYEEQEQENDVAYCHPRWNQEGFGSGKGASAEPSSGKCGAEGMGNGRCCSFIFFIFLDLQLGHIPQNHNSMCPSQTAHQCEPPSYKRLTEQKIDGVSTVEILCCWPGKRLLPCQVRSVCFWNESERGSDQSHANQSVLPLGDPFHERGHGTE